MCNQAVCLIQAELERRGITTVSLSLLRFIAERVRPPRALAVPFAHGRPLGASGDTITQHRVLAAMLRLAAHPGPPPVIEDLDSTA